MINNTRDEIVEVNRYNSFSKYRHKCLSWSAIIAGAIVAFVIGFLLNLFGAAIGLAAFTNTQAGVSVFAIGGFIALCIVAVASMFVGGMVAGYLGRSYCTKRNLGILYGFLAFGLSLFITALLATPMANFLAHYNQGLYGSSKSIAVIANPARASSAVISRNETVTNVNQNTDSVTAATTEKDVNDLGKAVLLTFILFAIGAFSACIGGHCGMKCKCDDEYLEDEEYNQRRPVLK